VRIGILGGTFNPPHLGHLICAQEAYLQLELDQVTLIPARIPPHKRVEEEPGPDHRLELCRAAVGEDDRFDVSDVEIVREGPSYTVDTLELLRSREPESELFLIVGGDIAAGLPKRVLSLATLAVAGRRGTSRAEVDEALSDLAGGERARFFQMPSIGISSTVLRRRVRDRQTIRYYVPDAVVSYIDRHRLYAG
jgi:nicotinate-nucleotide adenylyltransferase